MTWPVLISLWIAANGLFLAIRWWATRPLDRSDPDLDGIG